MSEQPDVTNPVADDTSRASAEGVAEDRELDTEGQSGEGQEGDEPEIDPATGEPFAKEPADDEFEEVEHDGAKHKIPKALKPLLMMQADYTKKTQEAAEARKALETERSTWQAQQVEQAAALEALKEDIGKVQTLKAQVAAFKDVDWAAAYQEAASADDPAKALAQINAAKANFDRLSIQLADADKELSGKRDGLKTQAQEAQRAAMTEVGTVLVKEIPGFNQERAAKLIELASSRGVSMQEMQSTTDPRSWLLLHDFSEAKAKIASLEKQLQQKSTVDRHAEAASTTPAALVRGGGTTQTGLRDDLSTAEWTRRRNAELAKRGRR
jgi:hypothetical protein